MTKYIYLDGKILPDIDAKISVADRAFSYGFGLFETLRSYNFSQFALESHLRRLASSAKIFRIPIYFSEPQIRKAIYKLLHKNRLANAAVRITLTAGVEGLSPHLAITARELPPIPRNAYSKGVKIILAPWHRSDDSPTYGHKTLNYLENILARQLAKSKNAFEAIFQNAKSKILEGSASNIFLVKSRKLFTPPLRTHILAGITRQLTIWLAKNIDIEVVEKTLTLRELLTADEIFITNSLIEIMPVSRMLISQDKGFTEKMIGKKIGLSLSILKAYRQNVEEYKKNCN